MKQKIFGPSRNFAQHKLTPTTSENKAVFTIMAFVPIVPLVIGGASTVAATVTAWFTLKYREMNDEIARLVAAQKESALSYTKDVTKDTLGSAVEPLKNWLRPGVKWASRGYLLHLVVTTVGVTVLGAFGVLALRRLDRIVLGLTQFGEDVSRLEHMMFLRNRDLAGTSGAKEAGRNTGVNNSPERTNAPTGDGCVVGRSDNEPTTSSSGAGDSCQFPCAEERGGGRIQ